MTTRLPPGGNGGHNRRVSRRIDPHAHDPSAPEAGAGGPSHDTNDSGAASAPPREDDFSELDDGITGDAAASAPAGAVRREPLHLPAAPAGIFPGPAPSQAFAEPDARVPHLAKVNMFSGLTATYLKRIASLCVEEHHPEGAFLFREGEPGDKLYIIVEGAVRIVRQVSGMGEEALAVLRAGDYFGEMALIDTFPRSADACAHEACRVLVMDKQKLEDLLFVDRDLAYDLLWNFVRTLSGRLRQTNDKMTFLAVTNRF